MMSMTKSKWTRFRCKTTYLRLARSSQMKIRSKISQRKITMKQEI